MLLLLFLASAFGAVEYGCSATANHGTCYNYAFSPGNVTGVERQKIFIARSGLIGGQYPYAAVAGARCRGDCPDFTSKQSIENFDPASSNGFRAVGGAFLWAYRGIGVVCDRDGKAGYDDPASGVAGTTICVDGSNPSASTDCVLIAATAPLAKWDAVETNLTYRPNVAEVEIEEETGIYKQQCYIRKGGSAPPTSPSDSTVKLGDFNSKCDIRIDKIAESRKWGSLTGNVWTLAQAAVTTQSVSGCPVANRRVALQLWFFGAAIASTPTTASGVSSLYIGPGVVAKWNTAVTCDYKNGASGVAGTAIPEVRRYTTLNGLPSGTPNAGTVGRVNFQFSCPPLNNGNELDRVNWDPEFSIDPDSLPDLASMASASMGVLMAALCIALLL